MNRKLLVFVLLLLSFLVYFSVPHGAKISKNNLDISQTQNPLGKVVQASLNGTSGTYAAVVKNLKTGENYSFNEKKIYDAGSLYKLWIMAIIYQQIEAGAINEDEILSGDVTALNEEFGISADSADLTEGIVELSVHDSLNQMITISHNYAALLLTEKVSILKISEFLNKYGFKDSSVGVDNKPPKTTSSNIALFFEKLYKGELANPENTTKMIELLKKQQLNDKLPKLLPEGTQVAHKTGEIDYQTHDGGIVYSPKGDYIIVIMSESDMPSAAAEREAQISKAVYDYFN